MRLIIWALGRVVTDLPWWSKVLSVSYRKFPEGTPPIDVLTF